MTRVIIPTLDANLVDVTVTCWKKNPGDIVEKGETIAELTTDKAAYELEAPASGALLQVLAPEKSVVPTGFIVAVIGTDGEIDSDAQEENAKSMAEYRGEAPQGVAETMTDYRPRVRATPKARRLARQHGLDLDAIARQSGIEVVDEESVKRFII
jgi:pyruvate/2-oxoglutarate dehydrogenase complex dihydrolipoamide acyltransferase (E2) component